ncbi:hypothetical protein QFZ23_002489 [Arthrobacter globiformis]|nr:hypothetical protein [Arthrobacter globiformis]
MGIGAAVMLHLALRLFQHGSISCTSEVDTRLALSTQL